MEIITAKRHAYVMARTRASEWVILANQSKKAINKRLCFKWASTHNNYARRIHSELLLLEANHGS